MRPIRGSYRQKLIRRTKYECSVRRQRLHVLTTKILAEREPKIMNKLDKVSAVTHLGLFL